MPYLGISLAIYGNLGLSLAVSGYDRLTQGLFEGLSQGLFRDILGFFWLSWATLGNLGLFLATSGYLELSLSRIKQQGVSGSKIEQVKLFDY